MTKIPPKPKPYSDSLSLSHSCIPHGLTSLSLVRAAAAASTRAAAAARPVLVGADLRGAAAS